MAGGNQSDAHSDLVKACMDYFAVQHAWTLKVLGGIGMKSGVPDIIAGIRAPGARYATTVSAECKSGKALLSKSQRRERPRMEEAGVLYLIVREPEDLEEALWAAGLIERRILQTRGVG